MLYPIVSSQKKESQSCKVATMHRLLLYLILIPTDFTFVTIASSELAALTLGVGAILP